ncbi:hypothetical protein NDR87_15060 [Nocardia sp. CDC159]|uniref:DUF8129 domain-containing protein n=1 Tax=Nocardia pulmonis TaxID=2951408 RepID=A0A9X2E9Z7_9NOCA|nr:MULTISPECIES: hypothetical protein [Nocardia]MCM6775590.1 hypothetical protein [Nocardia pulmonis]MCM6787676.1 hypothetical protein [Nocardia sp. CDC159]
MSSDEKILPLPDYDQLTAGDIEHRVRALELDQVRRLIDHERATAHRPRIVEILSARIAQLEAGAQPSGGDPAQAPPVRGVVGGSAADPEHTRADNTPLRHGVAEQTPARGKP